VRFQDLHLKKTKKLYVRQNRAAVALSGMGVS
jgi:hypothetical protein